MEERTIVITKRKFKNICFIFGLIIVYQIIEGIVKRGDIQLKYFLFDFFFSCFVMIWFLIIYGWIVLYSKNKL